MVGGFCQITRSAPSPTPRNCGHCVTKVQLAVDLLHGHSECLENIPSAQTFGKITFWMVCGGKCSSRAHWDESPASPETCPGTRQAEQVLEAPTTSHPCPNNHCHPPNVGMRSFIPGGSQQPVVPSSVWGMISLIFLPLQGFNQPANCRPG